MVITIDFCIETLDSDKIETFLDRFGREGWELVSFTPFVLQGKLIRAVCCLKRSEESN